MRVAPMAPEPNPNPTLLLSRADWSIDRYIVPRYLSFACPCVSCCLLLLCCSRRSSLLLQLGRFYEGGPDGTRTEPCLDGTSFFHWGKNNSSLSYSSLRAVALLLLVLWCCSFRPSDLRSQGGLMIVVPAGHKTEPCSRVACLWLR